ncbi:MAG: WhiB family transcriptional regulator [Thermoplasmata archaeon]|nr:WhiB family transcriptional regulator [Thermoplasmata archaeon]NIS21925.1 WhiB family transcriptional regulator [Thermoplasmata archaeon]NIT79782.1 WhiB family transcriptional regulator [Thermoplasmata archaeon]NIU50957.1 WhiB family transcriptional regulator [Thermoplasmata archaeon]NIV80658.1 WhiB family transcriptional regulator [Thermoplasmata archaeon]
MSWLQHAACGDDSLDPDVFFPDPDYDTEEEIEVKVRVAKDVCRKCPVDDLCLNLGMRPENLRWGIFGGLTSQERRYRAQKGTSK